jgi:hypothetical protein
MMKKQIGAQDEAECTLACLKQGGKLVLYDPSTKKTYQFQNQQKAMDYAGQRSKSQIARFRTTWSKLKPYNLFLNRYLALTIFIVIITRGAQLCAAPIPVKYKEGTWQAFTVLSTGEGKSIAAGEMIQTVKGERVTTEVVFHFNDGSFYDEVTVFSQNTNFHLITDHVKEQGPAFKNPLDVYIDAPKGIVKLSSAKGGRDEHHLRIPDDTANGMMPVLLRNISPSEPETVVSLVAADPKPRIVKLKIHPEGEQGFFTSGYQRKAVRFGIHVDIGGVAGVVAPVVGKQPPDTHVWVALGKVPIAVRFEGPLLAGDNTVFVISMANIEWRQP